MQAIQPDDAEMPDLAEQQAKLRKAHREALTWYINILKHYVEILLCWDLEQYDQTKVCAT